MRGFLCLFLCILCFGAFAQQKKFEIKAELDHKGENIFAPGSLIPVKIFHSCPADYQFSAWNVSVYAKNAPSSFGKAKELRIPIRVEASYWKLGTSLRLASNSSGVSKAM